MVASANLSAARARRFVARGVVFMMGAFLSASALDAAFSVWVAETGGRHIVGIDVRDVVATARRPDDRVVRVYLGDSVARQLFRPKTEPSPDVVFLTTNQSVSFAGHAFLLRDALASYPHLREVVLVTTPAALGNDLHTVYTNDYFCGPFHEPAQIRRTFQAKHDVALAGAQLFRLLYPNVIAWSRTFDAVKTRAVPRALLEGSSGAAAVNPARKVVQSSVTRSFLPEMHALCNARGVAFRMIPSPVPATDPYEDPERLFDAPFTYLDATHFVEDGVHLREQWVDEGRRAVLDRVSFDSAR